MCNMSRPWQQWGIQPARRDGPAADCPPVLIQLPFQFAPLIGNSHFLIRTRSLVAFPIGHEHHMPHGAQFSFKTLIMDDFQIGHGRYAGPIRYLSDFPYTNFAHSRDSDFPYTNFWGDLDEIAIFKNDSSWQLYYSH